MARMTGLQRFAVMAAIVRKGEVVAGVIYDPMGDDWLMAEQGAGAWLVFPDGRRLRQDDQLSRGDASPQDAAKPRPGFALQALHGALQRHALDGRGVGQQHCHRLHGRERLVDHDDAPDHEGDDDHDPLEALEVESASTSLEPPPEQLARAQVLAFIEKALEKLPTRQRQAFLLRYWEEMDVAEAAQIMGCSEGSVKTHCSRATHALAAILEKQGIRL